MGLFHSLLGLKSSTPRAKAGRVACESLEGRVLLSGITEYGGLTTGSIPTNIVRGPGGLWFTESNTSKIGAITTAGNLVGEITIPGSAGPTGITLGNDGNIYFTEANSDANGHSFIGSVTPSGTVTTYQLTTNNAHPSSITATSTGVWFTERDKQKIGFLPYGASAGTAPTEFASFPSGSPNGNVLLGITTGSDGNVYFAEVGISTLVAKLDTTSHVVTEYGTSAGLTSNSGPQFLTNGPDGNIWFTESNGTRAAIGRLNIGSGSISEFQLANSAIPQAIVSGPNGHLWFPEQGRNALGEMDTSGNLVAEHTLPTANAAPVGIAVGSDNKLWFTESNIAKIGVADPSTLSKNQLYVQAVFQDLFGRAPDAGALSLFAGQLDSGLSYHDLAKALTGSTEYEQGLVQNLYQTYLGRSAETQGLNNWVSLLRQGYNIENIRSFILSSDEYYNRVGGTPQSYITALYNSFLNRAPESQGLANWESVLSSQGRLAVSTGISGSDENRTAVVNGFYQKYLHRAPDAGGLALWKNNLLVGVRQEDIVSFFVSVPEYLTLHGIS